MKRVLIAGMLCAAAACGPKALSRSQAAERIKSHEFMRETIVKRIVVGAHCDNSNSYSNDVDVHLRQNTIASQLQPLVARHFVNVDMKLFNSIDVAVVAGFNAGGGDVDAAFGSGAIPKICRRLADSPKLFYWNATVTAQGVAAGVPAAGGVLQTHTKTFGEVTGIANNADGTSSVDFTFSYVPTEAGRKLGEDGTPPLPARAVFKLYDDGWRIMSAGRSPG